MEQRLHVAQTVYCLWQKTCTGAHGGRKIV